MGDASNAQNIVAPMAADVQQIGEISLRLAACSDGARATLGKCSYFSR